LVVPAVVCANAVAGEIATLAAATSITHQHGCAQVGDDAIGTTVALAQIASHPNAWATLVVSLGCETLQGRALVERLTNEGIDCALVGIQESGGTAATVEAGVRAFGRLGEIPEAREPLDAPPRIGIAFVGTAMPLANHYASVLMRAGFEPVGPVDASREPVLSLVELAYGKSVLGLLFVSDRGIPVAPPLVPLLAIAATRELYDDSEGEYDLCTPTDDVLVASCLEMLSGALTQAEIRGDSYFAVRRTLLTL
jgi:altronate dehydratase